MSLNNSAVNAVADASTSTSVEPAASNCGTHDNGKHHFLFVLIEGKTV